ncbi:S8 family serine peptidase [Haliangium sp.]|uniref:S8 family serine peptidase n=1 Tax=Haliangium sp. TaxID=2663208 RepID=UPI003D0F23A0
MDEHNAPERKGRGVLWLLVLIAVLALWWFFRPAGLDQSSEVALDEAAVVDMDPDDILVDLRDDVGPEVVADIERELGIDLELVSDQSYDERFYRAHIDPTRRAALLAALRTRPEVEIAEPDAYVHAGPLDDIVGAEAAGLSGDTAWADYPNDPMYQYQWHLRQIGMPDAWKLADGEGVVVAVIDTGVAYDTRDRFHLVPDLDGVPFVHPYNFVSNNEMAHDDHGHGTHVAGTIAQMTHNGVGVAGVGRKLTIMPLKVLSAGGSGSVAAIADAIRFAADNGAQVINMSLGGRFPSNVLKKAVKYAHDKGVVVVCAAGNDGRGKVSYPAAYPGAVAVAATQYDETTTFYSNWGKAIDVAAPGGNTRVDQNQDGMPDGVLQNTIAVGDPSTSDYFPYMGTSMASPHAAGVAALVVGEGVTDPAAVEQIMKDTARKPKDEKNYDKARYGAGIIDAPAAILKARSGTGGWQFLLGLLVAGALATSVRRRGLTVALGPGYLGGVMVGAAGLFFLPWLGVNAEALPLGDLITRGLPSWDLSLLGPAGHGNALFFSALIPLGLVLGLYGWRRLRAPLAGLAAGVAGHLLFHAAVRVTDIHYIPNGFVFDEMWLALNALVCIGLGALVLRR